MNRVHLACCCFIASAFVLTGLLVFSTGRILPEAKGEMVLAKGNLTFLTARTANNEEALFVLDNVTQRLLIYTTELSGRQGILQLKENRPLPQMFKLDQPGGKRLRSR